jgi:hypothetical protein
VASSEKLVARGGSLSLNHRQAMMDLDHVRFILMFIPGLGLGVVFGMNLQRRRERVARELDRLERELARSPHDGR